MYRISEIISLLYPPFAAGGNKNYPLSHTMYYYEQDFLWVKRCRLIFCEKSRWWKCLVLAWREPRRPTAKWRTNTSARFCSDNATLVYYETLPQNHVELREFNSNWTAAFDKKCSAVIDRKSVTFLLQGGNWYSFVEMSCCIRQTHLLWMNTYFDL